jgi:hypothetical protein
VATLIMSCAVSATNHVNCLNCTTTLIPATGRHYQHRPNHENAGDTDGFICRRMDMDMDMTFNPSKALIALVGLICMTVLIAVGAIEQDQGLPIITMIVGYSVGNGMAALSNKQVEPIIKKKNQ